VIYSPTDSSPLSTRTQDFHPLDCVHAGRTKKVDPQSRGSTSTKKFQIDTVHINLEYAAQSRISLYVAFSDLPLPFTFILRRHSKGGAWQPIISCRPSRSLMEGKKQPIAIISAKFPKGRVGFPILIQC
jgi:hypothetical protein